MPHPSEQDRATTMIDGSNFYEKFATPEWREAWAKADDAEKDRLAQLCISKEPLTSAERQYGELLARWLDARAEVEKLTKERDEACEALRVRGAGREVSEARRVALEQSEAEVEKLRAEVDTTINERDDAREHVKRLRDNPGRTMSCDLCNRTSAENQTLRVALGKLAAFPTRFGHHENCEAYAEGCDSGDCQHEDNEPHKECTCSLAEYQKMRTIAGVALLDTTPSQRHLEKREKSE